MSKLPRHRLLPLNMSTEETKISASMDEGLSDVEVPSTP